MEFPELILQLLLQADRLLAAAAVLVILAAGLGGFLEFVFPPFAGDTLVFLGFIAAARGQASFLLTFLVALTAGTAGAAVAYWLGGRLGGLPLLKGRPAREARLRRTGRALERYGWPLLLLNRFLPGIRGLFLPLAGIARIPLVRTHVAVLIGNALWLGMLAAAALAAVGGSASEGEAGLRTLIRWTAIPAAFLAVGVLALVIRAALRDEGDLAP
jgi:membrane protein DedA with SNARE-associated domain